MNETARGAWTGSFDGAGTIAIGDHHLPLSLPESMKGTGLGVNPEQLLAAASASCLMVTLGIILSRNKIPYQKISARGDAFLSSELPPTIQTIVLKVQVLSEAEDYVVLPLIEKAKQMCVIGRAMHPNIEVRLDATVGAILNFEDL